MSGYYRIEFNCWPRGGTGEPTCRRWVDIPEDELTWRCRVKAPPAFRRRLELEAYNRVRAEWDGDVTMARWEFSIVPFRSGAVAQLG